MIVAGGFFYVQQQEKEIATLKVATTTQTAVIKQMQTDADEMKANQ